MSTIWEIAQSAATPTSLFGHFCDWCPLVPDWCPGTGSQNLRHPVSIVESCIMGAWPGSRSVRH